MAHGWFHSITLLQPCRNPVLLIRVADCQQFTTWDMSKPIVRISSASVDRFLATEEGCNADLSRDGSSILRRYANSHTSTLISSGEHEFISRNHVSDYVTDYDSARGQGVHSESYIKISITYRKGRRGRRQLSSLSSAHQHLVSNPPRPAPSRP